MVPLQNLKSAEELEEEERAAQSAKLQELIRRGTPQDLQEANQLMKIMAGYDQTNKTDYRQKAAEDIAKLQEKQRLLDEMLAKVTQGESIGDGDAFEVYHLLRKRWFTPSNNIFLVVGSGEYSQKCSTQIAQDGRGRERRCRSCFSTIHPERHH
ncbi:hypothetical protein ABW20_dc0109889 [Dactylellina cionopaga]|nr:hypothetical protein ABW20_dc0109889 [Dactylellina cionopaga]